MPVTRHESFSFGGVSSRDNPANYPSNRALRCINWAPTLSGQLRLRTGYTAQLTNDTIGGTNSTIHSAVYYEQFSAAYLGPQYVLYGKGSQILSYNLSTQLSSSVGSLTTSNPWGHFRATNRIFLGDGVSNVNWDNSTLRVTGIPSPGIFPSPASLYSGLASNNNDGFGTIAWTNPGNAQGAPDGAYATVIVPGGSSSQSLYAQNYSEAVPSTATVTGITVQIRGHLSALSTSTGLPVLKIQLLRLVGAFGGRVGIVKSITVANGLSLTDVTITLGDPNFLWGLTWTPNSFNNAAFGVAVLASVSGAPSGNITFYIDSVQTTVYASGLSGATVAVTTSTLGSIAPTQLTGYQLFAVIYNPFTQHMGNRLAIGTPQAVGATASAFVVGNLPLLTPFNTEWEYALGMTQDGGQIPYWFVDAQGNNIVLGNGATNGTVYIGNINLTQELPFRNGIPPPMDKFARVGTRIFGGLAGNPFLYYSNDAADVSNANYVGIPEESWPADQAEPLPDGQLPTSIHAYRLEGWFFSRENLSLWSLFLLQQGVNPWRGPYPGGCPSQRGFIETPHGPFWISTQKQLCTFMEDGVVSVSDEYELSLLGQLADASLNTVELGYLLDQTQLVDQIVVKGLDKNGNPVIVIHDFLLREQRSPHGQGYIVQYGGLTVQTFVGAGFTPRQNVYDVNGKMRLWAGAAEGFFAQLEDGLDDNGATYSADYIGLLSLGPNRPALAELEYQGDSQISWSYCPDYSLGLGDFIPVTQDVIPEDVSTQSRFGVKFGDEECRWAYIRAQLTSHPADGNFAITDPPFLPIPTYGLINLTVVKTGRERPEAR